MKLRQDKRVRTFVWTTFNALVTLLVAYATDSQYAFLLIGVLNEVTKYANKTIFNDLGVE